MCLSSICVVHYISIYVCGLNSVLCPIQRGVKAWESAFDILKSKGCLLDRWMGQLFQYSSIHIHLQATSNVSNICPNKFYTAIVTQADQRELEIPTSRLLRRLLKSPSPQSNRKTQITQDRLN